MRNSSILLTVIFLGCLNDNANYSDNDFKAEFENSLFWVVKHHHNSYIHENNEFETEQFARSIDFLEEITQIKSGVEWEPPFFYFNDSIFISDLSKWMDWYKNSPKKLKQAAFEKLIHRKDSFPFPEKFFDN